jgi:Family of unknown function (DUF6262)
MTDDVQHKRIAVLTAAARAKSEAKTKAAERGIRALVKRDEPITFQAVQREAGVSHAFLYGNADLRARIERLRDQARPRGTPTADTDADAESTLVLALTAKIKQLQKNNREQVATLRAALEQAHGENLDLRRELARCGRHQPEAQPRHVVAIATTTQTQQNGADKTPARSSR